MASLDFDQKLDMSLDDLTARSRPAPSTRGPIRSGRRAARKTSPYKGGFSGNCHTCGGIGHRAAQCPSSPGVSQSAGRRGGASRGPATISTRVYVGNLAWGVRWQDLKDHMKQAGPVVRADVLTEGGAEDGRSKGCGVVEFASIAGARRAIDTLHDTDLQGRLIFVREDREAGGRGGAPSGRAAAAAPRMGGGGGGGGGGGFATEFRGLCLNCKQYGHTAKNCTGATACHNCGKAGHLASECSAPMRCNNCHRSGHRASECNAPTVCVSCGRSGHFSYECPNGSGAGAGGAGGARRGGGAAAGGRGPARGNQLYVGNLSWDTTWQDLKDAFKSAGTVEFADVMQSGGRSKGFGTVRFATAAGAQRAIAKLNGAEFDGRIIEVRLDAKA